MRLNKKRLAALAMSAVMAASAVPFPVYAEELSAGEDVVVSAETTVETPEVGVAAAAVDYYEVQGYKADSGEVEFTVYYKNNTSKKVVEGEDGEFVKTIVHSAATCQAEEQVTVTWKDGSPDITLKWGDKAEHTLGDDVYERTIQEPTCMVPGVKELYQICSVCNEEVVKGTEPIPTTEAKHDFDETKPTAFDTTKGQYENIKVKADGSFDLDKDGNPQLADVTKDGWYWVTKYCKNHKDYQHFEKKEIKHVTEVTAKIDKDTVKGIATDLTEYFDGNDSVNTFPLDSKKIELKDCDTAGSYEYVILNDGKEVSRQKVTVEAHHYNTHKVAVFATEADAKEATVKEEKDGSLTVTSNSCIKSIKYEEVTYCTAKGCDAENLKTKFLKNGNNELKKNNTVSHVVLKEAKEAAASNNHKIETKVKNEITKYIDSHDVLDVKVIEAIIEAADTDYVKVSAPEAVCENGGEITISYICTKDKTTVVETQKCTVVAAGHKMPTVATIENRVASTCAAKGTYDEVKYCERCGKELERVHKTTPRLKHTNESSVTDSGVGTKDWHDYTAFIQFTGDKVVDVDGALLDMKGKTVTTNTKDANGTYRFAGYAENGKAKTEFGVIPKVYSKCATCDGNVFVLDNASKPQQNNSNDITLKVVDVQKQDNKGQNGFITLEATYKTRDNDGLDYAHEEGTVITEKVTFPYYSSMEAYTGRTDPEVKDGLIQDTDGVYRYYVNGEFQKDFTGIINHANNKFLVVNGVLSSETSGLWYSDADKVWYFLTYGQVRADYTGTVLYDGEWFYVTNGVLNEDVSGLVPYNGGTFLFVEGRLRTDVSGLWQDINNPDDWYFLSLGQVQNLYSGVAQYDGGFFVVKEGKFDKKYNGTIKYDGETFKVVNGQLIIK